MSLSLLMSLGVRIDSLGFYMSPQSIFHLILEIINTIELAIFWQRKKAKEMDDRKHLLF